MGRFVAKALFRAAILLGTVVAVARGAVACGAFTATPQEDHVGADAGADVVTSDVDAAGTNGGRDASDVDAAPSGDAGSGGAYDASIDANAARLVFVTSESYTPGGSGAANFIGTDGADAICAAVAGAGTANLHGKTFIAWLSVAGTDAKSRIGSGPHTYVRVDGATVGDFPKPLLGGTLEVAIDVDQQGRTVAGGEAWTGTKDDGTADGANTCGQWQALDGGQAATVGNITALDKSWQSTDAGVRCTAALRLYCFQP